MPEPQDMRRTLESLYQLRSQAPGDSTIATGCALAELIYGAAAMLHEDLQRIEHALMAQAETDRRDRLAAVQESAAPTMAYAGRVQRPDRPPEIVDPTDRPYHDGP